MRAEAKLLRLPLDRPTGGSGLTHVEVLVVHLNHSDGLQGMGFSYALGLGGGAMLVAAQELCDLAIASFKESEWPHPEQVWQTCHAALNRVGRGIHYLALAAIDLACWDLHSKRKSTPLGVAFGGSPRPVRVYGSGGFRPSASLAETVDTAQAQIESGFTALKLRLTGMPEDFGFLEAVSKALPDTIGLMVDLNEKGTVEHAVKLSALCSELDVKWIEEPLPADDLSAIKELGKRTQSTIAIGEHLQGHDRFKPYLNALGISIAQPDLAMMGGMTECLRLAAYCARTSKHIAPHFLPGLFIHLAAVSKEVTWLEHFPLLEAVFINPPEPGLNGMIEPTISPGHGIQLLPDIFDRFGV